MPDPFAVAAAALFRAPGSIAAVYLPYLYDHTVGSEISTRVIRSTAEQAASPFGASRISESAEVFQLLAADVPNPRAGDALTITDPRTGEDQTFTVYGDPTLDTEGVTWTCVVNAA
jgi:hypothetical protein